MSNRSAIPPGSVASVGGPGATFRDVATQLAQELVTQLTQEHSREVNAMYQEVLSLRGELSRVAELMQGYLAREQQLHSMMEQLSNTYSEATSHFHAAHSQFSEQAGRSTKSHDQARRQLVDPMRDTENELQRIQSLLAQPPVPPPDFPPHLHQMGHGGAGRSPMGSSVGRQMPLSSSSQHQPQMRGSDMRRLNV
eukprot:TRINITY_DN51720_c0_g1_i1.p1 TRINITY_DN51720_c0_g1~~TRINITY_DN51720_c0_g1_i1.p1  ORF type:complete len:195 (+),score=29.53 TRINITY_DN51720_c0_g1_i1:90-674(+)